MSETATVPVAAPPAKKEEEVKKPAEDEEESGSEEETTTTPVAGATAGDGTGAAEKKKKRKKKNKKKKAAAPADPNAPAPAPGTAPAASSSSTAAPEAGKKQRQTDPPTIQVSKLFDTFPPGMILSYAQDFNTFRETSEEKRAKERLNDSMYEDARHAAEIHREVRKWAKGWLRPGLSMVDIANKIENAIRKITTGDQFGGGIAFPCGLSLNHCAAHYTPNTGDVTVLGADDVMKVDIGVHVNGRIVDSAFTVAFNPQFDPLLEAVREATMAGVKACGVDVRLGDVGAEIQEVMESYQVTIGGKTYDVKPIRNLYGHTLGHYQIHAGKSVPVVKTMDQTKMEENEFYAIETFGSTGRGHVHDGPDCSHYMKKFGGPDHHPALRAKASKDLLAHISREHGTLAFARRWLDDAGHKRHQLALKGLVDLDLVNAYPPLLDERGSFVAQFEHTVCLKPTCKEVFSYGGDY